MKKLMIALAAVAMTVGVQAAMVDWQITGVGDYSGKNVYAFNTTDQATVLAALTAGGDSIASTIAGLTVNKDSLAATVTGTAGRANAKGTATDIASGNNLFFIIFDGAIADGQKYAYSAGYDVSSKVYAEGQPSPGNLSLAFSAAKTEQMIGNVPEPTSGLLLLLGVAGLALRRRRA